jgi:hypothetical protein
MNWDLNGQMNKSDQIKYIKHADIDSEKWQQCIENAPNSRLYANEWHLDRTAEIWDALIWGDYEYVMPLPVRTKMSISYVYQPLYSQQLGIFPAPGNQIATTFYQTLYKAFRYTDIQINSENPIIKSDNSISFSPRKNYLLPLNHDYNSISSNYSKNTKRNIAKANQNNLNLIAGIRLEDFLEFKKENLSTKLSKADFGKLKNIVAFGQYKGIGEVYGVYSPDNKLCAAVYFCRWKDRVIYLNAASSNSGKELGAMYFLLDNFIRTNAGRELKIDFEGSMIPGVERFYKGFGAMAETYFQLQINRLPLLLKGLKNI